MKLLLLGATGELGRECLRAALAAGYEVRAASRQSRAQPGIEWVRVDLVSDDGVREAVRGMNAVIFAAGDPRAHRALELDGLRRLAEASQAAGVDHLIFVSIVGVDRIPVPYYATKLAAEEALARSGVPHTILRATQFHSFVDRIFRALAGFPLILPLPRGFQVQPVATTDVAARLLRCLTEGPRGRVPDFGGPEIFDLRAAAELWLRTHGRRKPIWSIPLPGQAAAAFRAGANTNPTGEKGTVRFADWLAAQPPRA
ncbi:MAG: NAD(P)H-binding protein [Verrucomicrobia bacterium]|nr:NAD(P)H-binding protein [Verrucomicrobiota bacterium]